MVLVRLKFTQVRIVQYQLRRESPSFLSTHWTDTWKIQNNLRKGKISPATRGSWGSILQNYINAKETKMLSLSYDQTLLF